MHGKDGVTPEYIEVTPTVGTYLVCENRYFGPSSLKVPNEWEDWRFDATTTVVPMSQLQHGGIHHDYHEPLPPLWQCGNDSVSLVQSTRVTRRSRWLPVSKLLCK